MFIDVSPSACCSVQMGIVSNELYARMAGDSAMWQAVYHEVVVMDPHIVVIHADNLDKLV